MGWALALAALLSPAVMPAQRATGRVNGLVFDSVAMQPLGGAVVQAVNAANPSLSRSVMADSLGRFTLGDVPVGNWVVAALHPRLDSLGLDQIRGTVDVRADVETPVTVAVPEARRLARLLCGEPAVPQDTSGYLVGTLRSAAADRAPVRGTVRVEWLELTITGRGFVRTRETRTAETGADGRYLACGIPAGGLVRVSAVHDVDSTGVIDLQMPFDGIHQRDLYVGAARSVRVPVVDAMLDSTGFGTDSLTVKRGDGLLRGRLLGATGAPLANARVAMREAGLEVRTDSAGRFAMATLPKGTWNLDVRAVGYDALTRPVDVLQDDSSTVSFTMSRFVAVDTFRIRAKMPNNPTANLVGFAERAKAGFGRYMGPEQLEQLQPLWFSDILLRFPALRLERADYGYVVTMRSTGKAARCLPRVYVDNILTPNDGTIDSYLNANQIMAVEVYPGAFGPPQYMDMLSGCGSIVVWTGPRTAVKR
jgi:hypothetical protein